jgi:hypothetical protein
MPERVASPPTARVVTVLKVVASAERPLGLSEIARAAECRISTCAQVLAELISAGWIERDGEKRHHLGTGLLPLADAVRNKYPSVEAFQALSQLHDEFGYEASLSRYDDETMTRVASVGGGAAVTAGPSLPLTPPFGIVGQSLLEEGEFSAWLDQAEPPIEGDRRTVMHDIASSVRSRGWAAWRLNETELPMLGAMRAAMPASLTDGERDATMAEISRVGAMAALGHIDEADLRTKKRFPVSYLIAAVEAKPRHQIELHILDRAMTTARIIEIGERVAVVARELAGEMVSGES